MHTHAHTHLFDFCQACVQYKYISALYSVFFVILCQYYHSEYVYFPVKYSVLFQYSVLFLNSDQFQVIFKYSAIFQYCVQYSALLQCSHFVFKYIHFSSLKLQQVQPSHTSLSSEMGEATVALTGLDSDGARCQ